ncbi:MAG: Ig-like domain-containing protein, partial [Muribaculaceae bacterium]|nr:Ig-like domain-containing protein [Muribaculaceae bacterium]
MTVGHSEIPLTLSNPKNLAITWTSSNPEVATVASNGTVTALKGGQATITATTSGTTDIAAGSVSYTLNVAE